MAAVPEAAGITFKDGVAPPIINPYLIRDAIGSDAPLVVDTIAIGGEDIGDKNIQAWLYHDEAAGGIGTAKGIVGDERDRIGAGLGKVHDGVGVGGGGSIAEVPHVGCGPLGLVGEGNLGFWLALHDLRRGESRLRTRMHGNGSLDGVGAAVGAHDHHPERVTARLRVRVGSTAGPAHRVYAPITPYPERLGDSGAIGVGGVFGLESERRTTFGEGEIPGGNGALSDGHLPSNSG